MNVFLVTDTGAEPVGLGDVGQVLERSDGVVWIDLGHEDGDGLRLLTDLVNTRPADLDDCHTLLTVPKLHAYSDHYFSAINGLVPGPRQSRKCPV